MATASDINKIYRETLGRDAGKDGLSYYVNRINSGQTIDDIRRSISASPEAQKTKSKPATTTRPTTTTKPKSTTSSSSRSSTNATSRPSSTTSSKSQSSSNRSISSGDINKLYRETLGRDAGSEGLDYWSNNASKGFTLDDIRKGIQNSDEYKNRASLQSQPPATPNHWNSTASKQNRYNDGQQRATSQLQSGFTPQSSYNGNSNNADFIRSVYQNETGRDADSDGLAYWTDLMGRGMRRDEVIQAFNNSQEGRGYDNPSALSRQTPSRQTPSQGAPQSQITPQQTSQYQLGQMLDSNSPLMQQAATMGSQRANSRGLLNSSMASQAAQGAMISAAAPFAQQDAQTYFQGDQANADRQQQEYMSRLGYEQQRGLNEQQYGFDMGRMQQEYGFNSELSTQEANQALNSLYATSTANGWGVMANNLTDIIGQYSGQLERIQMNPDIDEETKTSLIEDVLSMRDADLDFQRSMYDQLPNYLANTGVFPSR